MSTIKSKEDLDYDVAFDDLFILVNNDDDAPASVTHHQLLRQGDLITVGRKGRFPNIQSAVDYISTLENFIPTIITGMPTQVTSWSQGSSNLITAAATANVTNYAGDVWVQVEGEAEAYPLESFNGSGVIGMHVAMTRIGSDITVPTNLIYLRPRIWDVKLLESKIFEDEVLFDTPIAINFTAINAVWGGSEDAATELITKGPNFQFGIIRFGEGLSMINSSDRLMNLSSWNNVPNCVRFIHEGGVLGVSGNDWMSPTAALGDLTITNCKLILMPVIAVGHVFFITMRGDLKVHNVTVDVSSNDIGFNNDVRLFDGMKGRNQYISNVNILINDKSDQLIRFALLGTITGYEYTSVSNCTITCADASDVQITMVDYNSPGISGDHLYSDAVVDIANCHILASKGLGVHKIYADVVDTNLFTNVVVNIENCSGGIVESEPVGASHISKIQYRDNNATQIVPDNTVDVGSVIVDANKGKTVLFANKISVNNTSFGFQFLQAPLNAIAGQEITMIFQQDSVGGYAVTPGNSGFYNPTSWGSGLANEWLMVVLKFDGNQWAEINIPKWLSGT